MYQVLARKWRPKTFKELVGQFHIAQALSYALDHQRIHHAYLFTGTRGVGKTTIARIYAKSLNCLTNGISSNPCGICANCQEIDQGIFPDLIEIDAASRRGIEETKGLLDNVPYAPSKGRYKVYLIDEVHMFTRESFNALLKTLEEPPEHVKFILATTDPQKMPITVLSRCLQFHLKNLTQEQIFSHLRFILSSEGVSFENDALKLIAEAGNGSMRDSLSLLDQAIAFGMGKVLTKEVASLLGAVPVMQIHKIYQAIIDENAIAMRNCLDEINSFSPDYAELFKRFLMVMQEITVCQLSAQRPQDEIPEIVENFAQLISVETLQLWYQIATDTWQTFAYQPDARNALEMMLLRMIALKPLMPEDEVALPPETVSLEDCHQSTIPQPSMSGQYDQSEHYAEQKEDLVDIYSDQPKDFYQESMGTAQNDIEGYSCTDEYEQHNEYLEEMPKPEAQEVSKKKNQLNDFVGQPKLWAIFLSGLIFDHIMLETFAMNTCPIEYQNNNLVLATYEDNMQMIPKDGQMRLSEIISESVGETIGIEIRLDVSITTASQYIEADKQKRSQKLQQQFCELPIVANFISHANARVIDQHVKCLENKENLC